MEENRGGFLQRLQRRRGAGKGLQAEDIVLRAGSEASSGKATTKKRAQTSILLTDREPSPEGLLAELVGARPGAAKGDARAVLDSAKSKASGETQAPAWLNVTLRQSPQLDRLVPTARLALHELFSDDLKRGDIPAAVKRAVSIAVHRLSEDIRFTSREIQEAIQELNGLILGKGPLHALYEDPLVTDIFIDSFDKIRCLRLGQAIETPFRFRTIGEYEAFFTAMLQSVGRVLSNSSPVVDCVLKDEWRSRVNAVHGSLRENGESSLVIRVPRLRFATLYDLLRSQTMPAAVAAWLSEFVSFGEGNILVMGPTGSGKTTLTAALLSAVGSDERVCTIEEIPEIFVSTCQVEKLVSRPADARGVGEVGVDELLRAALHRAPHRIVMGEIRDKEGSLFLEALETGHSGSIATMHADNPTEGLWRLLDVIAAHENAPVEVIQRRIARSIHLVMVMSRIEGRPCVVDISEVLPSSTGAFQVTQLVRYEGENKGKRRWRKMVKTSYLMQVLSDRGVDLLTGPSLLAPPESVVSEGGENALGRTTTSEKV
jgi:pilus assembly protein CpaF